MTAAAVTHIDREFDEFVDKVVDRWEHSTGRLFMNRNRYVPTPAETAQHNYDDRTERLLMQIRTDKKRKAAA